MKRDIVVVLPDIRSTHNTGAFFRTADGAGVTKIVLAGITAPPPHPHLLKVSLGAEDAVPWEYVEEPTEALKNLREQGYQLVAVEQTPQSQHFLHAEYSQNVALVFGNEVDGLSEELTSICDIAVEIPMHGIKESLNVSVAGGILLYHVGQIE